MLKSDNFIVIQGWMCNELELKGNELLIFAIIYGFSQDGVSEFKGGRKYLSETFNISLPTVDKALNNLLKDNYITKTSTKDFIHTDAYSVNMGVVKKLYEGSKETLVGGSKETLLNNISNTKKDNINTISKDIVDTPPKSKSKKPNLYEKCVSKINDFTDDEILREYLIEFLKKCLENSKESNIPFYTNTFVGKLNALKRLSEDNYRQREIVLQSLDNGWNGFYQLKKDKQSATKRIEQLDNDTDDTYYKRRKDFMGGINGDTEKF